MLYIFVNTAQNQVYLATYDKDTANRFRRRFHTEFVANYWDDVEIYEVIK